MGIIRFIFAPLFWLRDIHKDLRIIRRLMGWQYIIQVRQSNLSSEAKEDLVVVHLRKNLGKEDAEASSQLAKRLLRFLT